MPNWAIWVSRMPISRMTLTTGRAGRASRIRIPIAWRGEKPDAQTAADDDNDEHHERTDGVNEFKPRSFGLHDPGFLRNKANGRVWHSCGTRHCSDRALAKEIYVIEVKRGSEAPLSRAGRNKRRL